MKWSNKVFRKYLRILHRKLGYLTVGMCLIYGISGFLLNHLNGNDPAFESFNGRMQLSENLTPEAVNSAWSKTDNPTLKKTLLLDEDHYRLMLDGGIGIYEVSTGIVNYEYHRKKPIIYFINKLHYNKVKHWTLLADAFAFILIFFALSGLLMVKGKNSAWRKGKWYLLAGIIIPLLFLIWL